MSNSPALSARKATNFPSGEIAAPASLPGQSVKRANVAFAKGSAPVAGVLPRISQLAMAARTLSTTMLTPNANGHRRGGFATPLAVAAVSDSTSKPNARSRADWNRISRVFSRQRETMRASAGGTSAGSGSGSDFRIAVMVSAAVSRLTGARPVSISYPTIPTLNRSERASTVSPRTCSGDM